MKQREKDNVSTSFLFNIITLIFGSLKKFQFFIFFIFFCQMKIDLLTSDQFLIILKIDLQIYIPQIQNFLFYVQSHKQQLLYQNQGNQMTKQSAFSLGKLQTLTDLVDEMPYLDEAALENYKKVISTTKLKLHKEISFRNVLISQNEHIHQIYTKSAPHLPHLVLLHGFGGTPMTFYKMFKDLMPHFQVHSLDIYGFGHSSRGNFSKDFTSEQTIQYYIKPIEEWRKALNIDRFYFVAHSFGGYIAASYAYAYPQRIHHLFLGSPIYTGEFQYWTPTQNEGCWKKMQRCLGRITYSCSPTPTCLTQSCLFHKKFMDTMMREYRYTSEEEAQFRKYYCNLHSKEVNSESGFYQIFEFLMKGKIKITDMIRNNPSLFDVDFYFGDKDWMPRQSVDELVRQNFRGVSITTVPKAGHGIFLNNPQFITKCILQRTNKRIESIISTQPTVQSIKTIEETK